MKYVAIFHANLNDAYLTGDRYECVIRSAYAMTLDVMMQELPGVPFVFEASGYTIEQMAAKTPGRRRQDRNRVSRRPTRFRAEAARLSARPARHTDRGNA
jgi:hypothetical protein